MSTTLKGKASLLIAYVLVAIVLLGLGYFTLETAHMGDASADAFFEAKAYDLVVQSDELNHFPQSGNDLVNTPLADTFQIEAGYFEVKHPGGNWEKDDSVGHFVDLFNWFDPSLRKIKDEVTSASQPLSDSLTYVQCNQGGCQRKHEHERAGDSAKVWLKLQITGAFANGSEYQLVLKGKSNNPEKPEDITRICPLYPQSQYFEMHLADCR